jgi:hypothetical protein
MDRQDLLMPPPKEEVDFEEEALVTA